MGAEEEGRSIINIRIFGKSLKQLAKDGISLESLLISIGLTNVEITEENPYQPTFSTTVCNVDVPRCSTPNNGQPDFRRKVTFNLPERISEITPNRDDNSIDNQWKLDVDEVINRLLEVVEENVSGQLSVECHVPRCSTPKASSPKPAIQRKFTLNLPERISEIPRETQEVAEAIECIREGIESPVDPSFDEYHTIDDTVDLSEEYPKGQNSVKTANDPDYIDWKECDKNKAFLFNCNFPNCNHQIKWERKTRLQFLSHALVHNTKEVFICTKCRRQKLMMSSYDRLRSHYVWKHPTFKVPRIGLYEHFARDEFLKNLVNECFGNEIDVINKRIKRKVLERKQVPSVAPSFISEEF
ncbi:unnamed protein product [Caenorhabditis nigoni]